MSKYPASIGVVVYQETNERVSGAAITATPVDEKNVKKGETIASLTNEDGLFNVIESDDAWMIDILHHNVTTQPVRWEPDGPRKTFPVEANNTNKTPGMIFFGALILLFFLLLVTYLSLHYKVEKAGGPLSNLLVQNISKAQNQFEDIKKIKSDFIERINNAPGKKVFNSDTAKALVRAVKNGKTDSVNAVFVVLVPSKDPVIKAEFDTLVMQGRALKDMEVKQTALLTDIDTSVVFLLRNNNDLMKEDKEIILALLPKIKNANLNNKPVEAEKYTVDLFEKVASPPWPGFVPWREEPWRFFEILLWALAGVLVQKIITTGVYLWKNRFQNKGIWMHVAHLFAVPLLVLVTMMLISMVGFTFSASTGGNGVVIDIGDPSITRAISFILAVAPWGVWDFVRAQSARITSRREDG